MEISNQPSTSTASNRQSCQQQQDGHRLHFRAAVSLNNIAVSLMQNGHYAAAVTALKDALGLMRTQQNSQGRIQQALRRAQHASQTPAAAAVQREGDPLIQVVSSQINPAVIGEDLFTEQNRHSQNNNKKTTPLYPITIDLVDMEGSPDVESFTLLYNYGIAYTCLARYCVDDAQDFCVNAHRIFQTAQRFMSAKVSSSNCSSNHARIWIVHLLLMRHLELTSDCLGLEAQADAYRQTALQWMEYLRVQEQPLWALPCGAAAA